MINGYKKGVSLDGVSIRGSQYQRCGYACIFRVDEMTELANELSEYWMRASYVTAVEIDNQWLLYLTKEKGFTQVNLGDYYIIGNDGEQIMGKVRFERLFTKHE